MKFLTKLILVYFILFTLKVDAQRITTQGKEFYVSFFQNGLGGGNNILFLSSKVNTAGIISNPNLNYTVPFSIAANTVTKVKIPFSIANNLSSNSLPSIQNRGLIITANDTIAVYGMNELRYTSDASNIYPKSSLGTDYLIATREPSIVYGFPGLFLIEATQDSTTVKIVPSVQTQDGHQSGVPYFINLKKAQTYLGSSGGDLSGTRVTVTNGCKPITVFSGASSCQIPNGVRAGDHLYEQLFPINTFGKQFITAPLKSRNTYFTRVYAVYDNTVINVNAVPVSTILAGKYYEFQSTNQPNYITTNKPVEVMEFATSHIFDSLAGPNIYNEGDPTMMTIPSIEQQITKSIFMSPQLDELKRHGVNVITKTSSIANTFFDGLNIAGLFKTIPANPLYSYASFETDSGSHQIENVDGFLAYAYGFGLYQGYGYCTGSSADRIDTYFNCNGTSSIGKPTIDVCNGQANFDVITSNTNVNYVWNFGDNSPLVTTPGIITHQSHTYNVNGTYTVTLTANNNNNSSNCSQYSQTTSQITLNIYSSIKPSVKIVSSPLNPICQNKPVTFVATAKNCGTNPTFHWFLNGNTIGTNLPYFTDSNLNINDVVKCSVINHLLCATDSVVSDSIIIQTIGAFVPTISIATPNINLCDSSLTQFTATIANGCQSPSFYWLVNGINVISNISSYSYKPQDGDSIKCVLSVTNACSVAEYTASNNIIMHVQYGYSVDSVRIDASATNICAGTSVSFSAKPFNGGLAPKYQWKINGVNVGTNSNHFSSNILKNGDTVSCVMISNYKCVLDSVSFSNIIVMQVLPVTMPTIAITSSSNAVCAGDTINFNAQITNGGTNPMYKWLVNNIVVDSNKSIYSSSILKDKDTISCMLRSNVACPAIVDAYSNNLIITLTIPIAISINSTNTNVCEGSNIVLTATVTNAISTTQYQWQQNGINVGTSTTTLSLNNISIADTGNFVVNATNGVCGNVMSNILNIKVRPNSTSTTKATICDGESYLFNGNSYNSTGFFLSHLTNSNACDSAATLDLNVFANTITVEQLLNVYTFKNQSVVLSPIITGTNLTYIWQPSSFLNSATSEKPVCKTLNDIQYKIIVTDGFCRDSGIVNVEVLPELNIPNVFSPNGDGVNDTWEIKGLSSYNGVKVAVYDRYGQLVFSSIGYKNSWTGENASKQPLPIGTFYYIIEIAGYANKLTGSVSILR